MSTWNDKAKALIAAQPPEQHAELLYTFIERSAICEDGGLSREEADRVGYEEIVTMASGGARNE